MRKLRERERERERISYDGRTFTCINFESVLGYHLLLLSLNSSSFDSYSALNTSVDKDGKWTQRETRLIKQFFSCIIMFRSRRDLLLKKKTSCLSDCFSSRQVIRNSSFEVLKTFSMYLVF
jgi:hypothetical protein